MRRSALALGAAVLLLSCMADPVAGPGDPASGTRATTRSGTVGEVQQILSLTPLTDVLEGIAIDHRGNIFVTHGRLVGDTRTAEILRISPQNRVSVFATLERGLPTDFEFGASGLTIDSHGNLYVAVASPRPLTHGVWQVRRDGSAAHVAGSEAIDFPDGLTLDAAGNLYVTDARAGAIWRFPPTGRGSLWLQHDLLELDFGVGANGIVFVPPRTLYVANTDKALIARVPILPSGRPGRPTIAAQGPELLGIDGLTADAHGDLYAAIILHVILGTAPIVRLDPHTGTITPITDQDDAFDLPTSPTFGAGPLDHKSLFVVNSGFFPEDRPEAAPGVVRVRIGVPGVPAH